MKDLAMRKCGKGATDATRQITTLIHRLPPQVAAPLAQAPINERDVIESAQAFPEQESGVPIHITGSEDGVHLKAAMALPFKPAIIIE